MTRWRFHAGVLVAAAIASTPPAEAADCLAYLAADRFFHEKRAANGPIFRAVGDALEAQDEGRWKAFIERWRTLNQASWEAAYAETTVTNAFADPFIQVVDDLGAAIVEHQLRGSAFRSTDGQSRCFAAFERRFRPGRDKFPLDLRREPKDRGRLSRPGDSEGLGADSRPTAGWKALFSGSRHL